MIAILFWVGGYAILAVRATLIGGDSPPLFSEARLVATLAGAAMLFATMLLWERMHGTAWRPRLAVIVGAIITACAAMFVVRLATALAFGLFGPTELADGGRWLIAWAGYFLAAVSSYIAFAAIQRAENARLINAHAASATSVFVPQRYESADDIFADPIDGSVRSTSRQFNAVPP